MKVGKFIIFSITILSLAIVIFNNLTQLVKEIFNPVFNPYIWLSFGIIVFATIFYAVINKDMLK